MAFKILSNYLPEEISLLALDYTGKESYENEKKAVIEELQMNEAERFSKRYDDFMKTTQFYNRDLVDGIFEWPNLYHWTRESSELTSMEILMDDDTTEEQWESAKNIMSDCDFIGMSLHEALALVDIYVFNEPATRYTHLVEFYERVML